MNNAASDEIEAARPDSRIRKDVVVWWTELKTPAANLPSGHRSQAIKPDYRMRRAPLSSDHPDVLIVEVKQYKRSNTDNFSAAIADYAHAFLKRQLSWSTTGRFPVACWKMFQSIYATGSARSRTFDPTGKRNAESYVEPLVCKWTRRRVPFRQVIPESSCGGAGCLLISIHVFEVIGKRIGQEHLYFEQRALGTAVRLLDDVTNGHGPEVAVFQNTAGVYLVCVHQYSNDGNLTASGATVTVYDEGNRPPITCEVPRQGNGAPVDRLRSGLLHWKRASHR
jgi:hypothetical protein